MELKNPIFGNVYRQNEGVTIRPLMYGAERRIIYDPNWPVIEQFTVEFRAMSAESRDAMLQFYRAAAGQLITLQDHESFTWQGYIIGDEGKVTCERDGCNYRTSFTFEGTKSAP